MKKKRWMPNEVKALRGRLELTQAAFGERVGVSGNYVWMIEAGQKNPSTTLKKLLDCIDRDEQRQKTK